MASRMTTGSNGQDESAHGQAIHRRRGDQAEIADAGERHLQGPRDRRRRQRQHVDIGAEPFEPLLVGDAEMLLLVDDQQSETLKWTSLANSAWVPTAMSMVPSARPALTVRAAAGVTSRESSSIRTGRPRKRSPNVR